MVPERTSGLSMAKALLALKSGDEKWEVDQPRDHDVWDDR